MYSHCGLPAFVEYYLKLPRDERRHYEIVLKGYPCKLYFDLESPKNAAPSQKTKPKMDRIICEIKSLVGAVLGPSECEILEAHRPDKSSTHLVLPHVFRNNQHMKHFVLNEVHKNLSPEHAAFIDLGVYDTDRCFRMLASQKQSKGFFLTLGETPLTRAQLLKSLVTAFRMPGEEKDLPPGFEDLTLVEKPFIEYSDLVEVQKKRKIAGSAYFPGPTKKGCPGPGPGPDPGLIGRVEDHLRTVVAPGQTIYSDVFDYPWCGFDITGGVCRADPLRPKKHKSNGIRFVLHLESLRGSFSCYDPDCKGYKWGRRCYCDLYGPVDPVTGFTFLCPGSCSNK